MKCTHLDLGLELRDLEVGGGGVEQRRVARLAQLLLQVSLLCCCAFLKMLWREIRLLVGLLF